MFFLCVARDQGLHLEMGQPLGAAVAAAADKSGRDASGQVTEASGGGAQPCARAAGPRNRPNLCMFPRHETVEQKVRSRKPGSRCLTGRQGGCPGCCEVAPAAVAGVCGCRRARARGSGGQVAHGVQLHQPSPAARHRLLHQAALANHGGHARGALDRGPSHWTGRAGLRAPRAAQHYRSIVCTKTSSDGESQQARS